MINLDIPKKLRPIVSQAHMVAENVFRPISRKYDTAEHAYPEELDMLAALLDGMNDSGAGSGGVSSTSVPPAFLIAFDVTKSVYLISSNVPSFFSPIAVRDSTQSPEFR